MPSFYDQIYAAASPTPVYRDIDQYLTNAERDGFLPGMTQQQFDERQAAAVGMPVENYQAAQEARYNQDVQRGLEYRKNQIDAGLVPLSQRNSYDTPEHLGPIGAGMQSGQQNVIAGIAGLLSFVDPTGSMETLRRSAQSQADLFGSTLGTRVDEAGNRTGVGGWQGFAERGLGNTASTLTSLGLTAGGGTVAGLGKLGVRALVYAQQGASTYSSSYQQSLDSGRTKSEALKDAAIDSTIEVGTTVALERLGLGGLEGGSKQAAAQLAAKTLRQKLTQAGVQTLGELGEENFIALAQGIHGELNGVGAGQLTTDGKPDLGKIGKVVADTSFATLLTMGAAQGTQAALNRGLPPMPAQPNLPGPTGPVAGPGPAQPSPTAPAPGLPTPSPAGLPGSPPAAGVMGSLPPAQVQALARLQYSSMGAVAGALGIPREQLPPVLQDRGAREQLISAARVFLEKSQAAAPRLEHAPPATPVAQESQPAFALPTALPGKADFTAALPVQQAARIQPVAPPPAVENSRAQTPAKTEVSPALPPVSSGAPISAGQPAQTAPVQVGRHTLENIQKHLPGWQVSGLQAGNGWRATRADGRHIDIEVDPDLAVDERLQKRIKKTYGKELPIGRKLAGHVTFKTEGVSVNALAVIRLGELANKGTLKHELLHVAKRFGLIPDPQWQQLVAEHVKPGDTRNEEEQIVDGVARYKPEDPRRRGLLQTLATGFDNLLAAAGLKRGTLTTKQLLQDWEQGQLFKADPADDETPRPTVREKRGRFQVLVPDNDGHLSPIGRKFDTQAEAEAEAAKLAEVWNQPDEKEEQPLDPAALQERIKQERRYSRAVAHAADKIGVPATELHAALNDLFGSGKSRDIVGELPTDAQIAAVARRLDRGTRPEPAGTDNGDLLRMRDELQAEEGMSDEEIEKRDKQVSGEEVKKIMAAHARGDVGDVAQKTKLNGNTQQFLTPDAPAGLRVAQLQDVVNQLAEPLTFALENDGYHKAVRQEAERRTAAAGGDAAVAKEQAAKEWLIALREAARAGMGDRFSVQHPDGTVQEVKDAAEHVQVLREEDEATMKRMFNTGAASEQVQQGEPDPRGGRPQRSRTVFGLPPLPGANPALKYVPRKLTMNLIPEAAYAWSKDNSAKYGVGHVARGLQAAFDSFSNNVHYASGDFEALTHELGHDIIANSDLIDSIPTLSRPQQAAILAELNALGQRLYAGHPVPVAGYTVEGFAEFVREFVCDPTLAVQNSPEVHAWFSRELRARPKATKAMAAIQAAAKTQKATPALTRYGKRFDSPHTRENRRRKSWEWLTSHVNRSTIWNSRHDFEVVRDAMTKHAGKPNASQDPAALYRAMSGRDAGITERFLQTLDDVVAPLAEMGEEGQRDLDAFLQAKVTEAELDFATAKNTPPRETGMSPSEVQDVLNQARAKYAPKNIDLDQIASGINAYSESILDFMAKNSPTLAVEVAHIRAGSPAFYAPMILHNLDRDSQDFTRSGINGLKALASGKFAKAKVGSTGERLYVLEALRNQTANRIRRTHVQIVVDALAQAALQTPDLGMQIYQVEEPNPNSPDSLDVFTYMDAGTRRFFKVSPRILSALEGLSGLQIKQLGAWAKVFKGTTRLQKAGWTGFNPRFGLINNVLMDVPLWYLKTRASANPLGMAKDWLLSAYHLAERGWTGRTADDATKFFFEQGLAASTFYHEARPTAHQDVQRFFQPGTLPDNIAEKIGFSIGGRSYNLKGQTPGKLAKAALDGWKGLMEWTQQTTMVAELRRVAEAKGIDLANPTPDQAIEMMDAAKALMPYGEAGSTMKQLSQIFPLITIPFLDARSAVEAGREVGWRKVIVRGLLGVTLPTMLLYLLLARHDEEWKRMPDDQKWEALYLPAWGPVPRTKISMNSMPQKIFMMPIVALHAAFEKNPTEALEFARDLVAGFWPNNPALVQAIGEQGTNSKTPGLAVLSDLGFPVDRGAPIDTYRGDPRESTPNAYRGLPAPNRAHALVDTLSGGLVTRQLRTAEWATGTSDRPAEPADVPVLGAVVQRDQMMTQAMLDLSREARRLEAGKATETRGESVMRKRYDRAQDQIGELRKQLQAAETRVARKAIVDRMHAVALGALGRKE